jgi:hypothetical protein
MENVRRGSTNKGSKKSDRIAIPLLEGAFNDPLVVRAHAQEFFLSIVMEKTPAPLYSLRDDVVPRYVEAFTFELRNGVEQVEIGGMTVRAIVDLVWINRSKQSALPEEVLASRRDHPLLYTAGEALILWCERFSLKAADSGSESEAREDSNGGERSWPLLVALQTVFFWCFDPIGHVWARSNPPKWRPPFFRLKPVVPDNEILPPIQLRTDSVDLSSGNVSEIDVPGWYISLETAPAFRKRMHDAFEQWLGKYVAAREKVALEAGLQRTPEKRQLVLQFTWLAKYQIDKVSPQRLAREYKRAVATVEEGIDTALELIQLEKRAPVRGGTKGSKHRNARQLKSRNIPFSASN